MQNPFKEHPQSVGETYTKHCVSALIYSFEMAKASGACFIHAIFPFLFAKTASNLLLRWLEGYVARLPAADERIIHLWKTIEIKLSQDRLNN